MASLNNKPSLLSLPKTHLLPTKHAKSASKNGKYSGKYSLSRLFLSFYLLVMGAFIAIAFFADVVISNALRGITDDYTRRVMSGTVVLIENELFRRPRSEWSRVILRLNDNFSYSLTITDRWSLNLPKKQAEKLDGGELVIDAKGVIYHRLKQTPEILMVGPIALDGTENSSQLLSLDLRIRLLTWSLIGFCLAIVVWFWVRPIWRDLENLRQTALLFGEGHFEIRAPTAKSGAFELLTETLNAMAEQVQRSLATQKEISSAVSHELRTPIARMRFAFEMILETENTEEQARLRKMIDADLDELGELIDSSLSYTRFEREQPEAKLELVDFSIWLTERVDSLRILSRNLEILLNDGALPYEVCVELDEKSMPYAITNLLRNAIRHAKTRIVVSAEIKNAYVFVHVDDDGEGVPIEDRERIFAAFTRLDQARTKQTGGYGLGLAITKLVLEQHQGSASVTDSPLGGARFTLSWPVTHLSPPENAS